MRVRMSGNEHQPFPLLLIKNSSIIAMRAENKLFDFFNGLSGEFREAEPT